MEVQKGVDLSIWKEYVNLYDKFTFNFQKEVLEYAAKRSRGKTIDAGNGVGKLLKYLNSNNQVSSIVAVEQNKEMKDMIIRKKDKYQKPVEVKKR